MTGACPAMEVRGDMSLSSYGGERSHELVQLCR